MYWYLSENPLVAPENISGLARVYAQREDPDNDCLVGCLVEQAPGVWTVFTVEEAREHFEAVYGRASTPTEVY